MAAKIIAFLTIALLNAGAGFILFFSLLLGLNGYHENDAQWSIYSFIGGALIITILMGAGGVFLTSYLIENKNYNAVWSVIGSTLLFVIMGIVMKIVLLLGSVFLAEAVRNSHTK